MYCSHGALMSMPVRAWMTIWLKIFPSWIWIFGVMKFCCPRHESEHISASWICCFPVMNLNTLVMNLAFHVMNMCMYLLSPKMLWKIAANDTHTSIQRWTQFNTSNIKISRHSRLCRHVAPGHSGPGLWWVPKTPFIFRNKRFNSLPSLLPNFRVYDEELLYIVQKVYIVMNRTIGVSIAGPPATRASVLAH